MTIDTDRIFEELQKLVAELKAVAAQAKKTGKRVSRRASEKVTAADEAVRGNPWVAVAIGAAAAVLLGFALARGSASPEDSTNSDG